MSEFIESIRKMFYLNDEKRDKNFKTPESIERYDNNVYGYDSEIQKLDVYTLKDKKNEKQPVIINVHGGGWVYGTKETYQFYCMDLAKRGFKVVNYSYRLAPENNYPSPIEDLNLILKWVQENSEKYHFDLNNLFAIGDSAGANILGIYCGIISAPEKAKLIELKLSTNLKFKAVAFNHGCYDLTKSFESNNKNKMDMSSINDQIMIELFHHNPTKEELESISVPTFITKHYPPIYIVSSSEDFLIDEPIKLINVLTQNRIQFIYHFCSISNVELPHVFHLDLNNKYAKMVNDEECEFFKSFI